MNQIVHKNFLNSLINSTQQNLSATASAFDLARSAGLTFETDGNFESRTQLTGTNQDDTVIIGGNLIGGNNKTTSIALQDGNDTVTIGGDVIAHDMQSISITGGTGSKTIHVNGGMDLDHSKVDVIIGSTNNISYSNELTIDGEIKATHARTNLLLTGEDNTITVNNGIHIEDNTELEIFSSSRMDLIDIKGDISIDLSTLSIGSYAIDRSDRSAYTEVNIDGNISVSADGDIDISLYTNNSSIVCKDLTATDGSSIAFETYHRYSSSINEFFIEGNITITDYSSFDIFSNARVDVEVAGSMIVQDGSVIDIDINGGDVTFLGGILNTDSYVGFVSDANSETNLYIEGDVTAGHNISPEHNMAINSFQFMGGNVVFTLMGDLTATGNSENEIETSNGNDQIFITGDISVANGGKNSIYTDYGDDIISLNGHIDAGALEIDAGEGNDTLVLSAVTQRTFEANYKEWLVDLSSTGSLSQCGIETIKLDVRGVRMDKLGWFTDIINQANADGAHIAVEDKAGHQLINPSAYLAQNNDTHNPINDVLDHYAPAAAAAQPKAFAENATAPSGDAFTAPHFDDNSFLHEMEQQAQVHAASVA